MADLDQELQNALAKTSEFQMLGSLAENAEKRKEYRAKAEFYRDVAQQLRKAMGNTPVAKNPPPVAESKPPPDVQGN
jgi:hypothetical protein